MAPSSSRAHELALSLRTAYMALHRATDAALAGWGVTADQFVVLSTLARGEALSQRELVERTSSDPSTLRAMLVLLEGKGLIDRQPHPRDGRARSVRLTGRGRSAFGRMWSATEPVRQRLAAGLGPPEIAPLIASLGKIVAAAERGPRGNRRRSITSTPDSGAPSPTKGN